MSPRPCCAERPSSNRTERGSTGSGCDWTSLRSCSIWGAVDLRWRRDDHGLRDARLSASAPIARGGRTLSGLCLHRVHPDRPGPPNESGEKAGGPSPS